MLAMIRMRIGLGLGVRVRAIYSPLWGAFLFFYLCQFPFFLAMCSGDLTSPFFCLRYVVGIMDTPEQEDLVFLLSIH